MLSNQQGNFLILFYFLEEITKFIFFHFHSFFIFFSVIFFISINIHSPNNYHFVYLFSFTLFPFILFFNLNPLIIISFQQFRGTVLNLSTRPSPGLFTYLLFVQDYCRFYLYIIEISDHTSMRSCSTTHKGMIKKKKKCRA